MARLLLTALSLGLLSSCAGAGPIAIPPASIPVAPAARATSSPAVATSLAFDPAPWLEDLGALVVAMSAHYANLDHAVDVRRLDLAAVRERAERRLRAATTVDQARRALRQFLNAFGDGHLSIDWAPAAAAPAATSSTTAPLCTRLGFEVRDSGGVAFTLTGAFTVVDDAEAGDFPGGVLRLPGGAQVAVLRITLFDASIHPRLCEAALSGLGLAADAACDAACADRVMMEVANRLTEALERRVRALARKDVRAIVVDLTGNGGGSSWVEPAVRVLSPAPLPSSAVGAVRHEHWVKDLRERLADVEEDRAAHGDLPGGVLAAAAARLRREIEEVQTPCDKGPLWLREAPRPACTQLVRVEPILPYAKPGELEGRPAILFGPSQYRYHEHVHDKPVAVLVDEDTASAAEDFVEELQDHHAALVLGAPTVGAGCGFTNGGIPTVLPRSGARVKMPDCARFRTDGSNAVDGITPDVVLPLLERDSPYQRAQKILAGLSRARERIVAGKRAPLQGVTPGPRESVHQGRADPSR